MNSINHNLMAANVANNLNSHYGKLATSIERLSSGLRINSAADDAAGLAIRELMRADVAALQQGMRNANDAISMIQVADGALAVIDEKLIRMKEIAEQAATGTYNSTQRLMIDSEFQAMGEEIDRIARATDFNGVKLLDGSLSGSHDGSSLDSTGRLKIHFGSANDSAEDYYYVDIGDCTTGGLGLREATAQQQRLMVQSHAGGSGLGAAVDGWWNDASAVIDYDNMKIVLDVPSQIAGAGSPAQVYGLDGFDSYNLPEGLKNVVVTSNAAPGTHPAHKSHVALFTRGGVQLTGVPTSRHGNDTTWTFATDNSGGTRTMHTVDWWNGKIGGQVLAQMKANGLLDSSAVSLNRDHVINDAGQSVTVNGVTVNILASQNEIGSGVGNNTLPLQDEMIYISEITSDLVFMIGGHVDPIDLCSGYSLRIEAEMTEEFLQNVGAPFIPAVNPPGPGNPESADTRGEMISIKTQEEAQLALERIDDAIVAKDKVRAHLGALQNRLENTVTNLTIQGENLRAAESRISDTDVATEMTIFVRNQILTQSAVAMLGQANSYPHMLIGLITG